MARSIDGAFCTYFGVFLILPTARITIHSFIDEEIEVERG